MEHPSDSRQETINGISHDAELHSAATASAPQLSSEAAANTGQISSCGIPTDPTVSPDEASEAFHPTVTNPSDMSSHSSVPPSPQENPISSVQEDKNPFDDDYFKSSVLPTDPWSEQQDDTSGNITEIGKYNLSPYSSEAHQFYEQERSSQSQESEVDDETENVQGEYEFRHETDITAPDQSNKHPDELVWQTPKRHEEDQQKRERSPSPISLNEEPAISMRPNPLSEDSANRETNIAAGDSDGRYSPVEKAPDVMPSKEEIQFRQDSINSEDYFPLDGKVAKKIISPEKRSPSPIEEIEEIQTEKEGIHSVPPESSPLQMEFPHLSNISSTNIPTAGNANDNIPTKNEVDFRETRVADNEKVQEPEIFNQKTFEPISDQPPNAFKPSDDLPASSPEAPPPQENVVVMRMRPKISVPQDSQDSQTSPAETEGLTVVLKPPEPPKPQLPPPIVKISAPAPEVVPPVYEFKPITTVTTSKVTGNSAGSVKATDSIPMIDAEEADMRPSNGTPDAGKSHQTRRERITKGIRRLCCIL